MVKCTAGSASTDETDTISALTDVATGAGAINIQCEGNYTAKLVVRDGAGANVEVRSWRFEVLPRDTSVAAYGPNGMDCVHGDAVDGEAMDRSFTCECGETQFTGLNCEVEPESSSTASYVAIGVVVLVVLCLAGAYIVYSGKDRRGRLGMARKAADPSYGATKAELTDGLLAAVEFGELGLVPALIELGADASVRGVSGQLPHADALRQQLQLDNPMHVAAMKALFHAHCEFDAQIGACIQTKGDQKSASSAHALVEHVLCELARSAWKSPLTGNTVAHKILEGCYKLSLDEEQTVQLMEAVLLHDATILTTANARGKTPTDLALLCEGMLEIQSRFTVVLFNRYQIVRPQHPLYKSPTAEVHECNDLTQLANEKQEDHTTSVTRCVVKLMSNPDLWLRELQTRDTLGADAAGSYVGAISAAVAEQAAQSAAESKVAVAARAATKYATTSSSEARPVTVFQPAFIAQTRREEARSLMTDYPYAIQMPLADRNLNEIIASERLAEEPLDVIRQSGRKVLNLIQNLHNKGVVHGDVKPKNVVRVDRALMLIDLDMAITIGSSDPPAHANKEKFSGSTAYAAPELHRWMSEHEATVDAGTFDGSSPVDTLSSPQQIDLWSFAVTLYEMATGSPLFQNSYDRATAPALAKLNDWTGLDPEHLIQIESLHGATESAALRDVLVWSLDSVAASRPKSVAELTTHAFFDPRGGAMRENFVVNHIRQLLTAPPADGSAREDVSVMISYCWSNSDFVLSRLAVEVAPRVRGLWLDRLGGEHGMGEFAQASMKRGVENADVIIAVVSPSYIGSTNCGYEMELARASGKPVIPVVLNVPFQEWPPRQIGQAIMGDQFATAAGDVKIFVDMSDSSNFFQKFKQELLPRLREWKQLGDSIQAPTPRQAQIIEATVNDALASDVPNDVVARTKVSRPGRGRGKNKVAPAAAPPLAEGANTQLKVRAGEPAVADAAPDQTPVPPVTESRGNCTLCGKPVLVSQERELAEGDAATPGYYHTNPKDCEGQTARGGSAGESAT